MAGRKIASLKYIKSTFGVGNGGDKCPSKKQIEDFGFIVYKGDYKDNQLVPEVTIERIYAQVRVNNSPRYNVNKGAFDALGSGISISDEYIVIQPDNTVSVNVELRCPHFTQNLADIVSDFKVIKIEDSTGKIRRVTPSIRRVPTTNEYIISFVLDNVTSSRMLIKCQITWKDNSLTIFDIVIN